MVFDTGEDLKLKLKNDSHRINDRAEFLRFCRLFFKKVSEELMEREAGVCIKGLGYFYVYLIPRKMTGFFHTSEGQQEVFNHHTDNHTYALCYVPNKKFGLWSMDASFSDKMRKQIAKNLSGGLRYNGYPYTMKKMI
jgi:hypothetical protein